MTNQFFNLGEDVRGRVAAWVSPRKFVPVGALVLGSLLLVLGKGIATTRDGGLGVQTDQSHQRWVNAIAQRRTADGSTVAEVLAYAESQRPEQFKVADVDVRFNGMDAAPDSVVIGYWIGSNRKVNDSYVDLSYVLTPNGQVQPIARSALTLRALEGGKAAFVQQIDTIYAMACKPFPESKPRC